MTRGQKDTSASHTNGFLLFNAAAHVISGILVACWVVGMFAPNGQIAGADIVKTVLIGVAVTGSLIGISALGLIMIPTLPPKLRPGVFTLVILGYLLFAVPAGLASASIIGRATGERAYRQDTFDHMKADVGRTKALIADVEALIPILQSCATTATDLGEREVESGAISQAGGLAGPVAAEIASIKLACDGAAATLVNGRAVAADIFLEMDRLLQKTRRLIDDDSLAPDAIEQQLIRNSEDLSRLGKELATAMPLDALSPAAQAVAKDRAAMGLSPASVAVLRANFRPIAKALSADIDATAENLKRPFFEVKRIGNPMRYLWLYPGDLAAALGIGLLLEFTPLLVVAVFALKAMQDEPSGRGASDRGAQRRQQFTARDRHR